MPFHHHVLPNGLEIIGETSPSALSVALGFFVRTGSRDESPEECGVSHFLEHMMFKGTPRRSAHDVNRDFDRIGANNNAATSEESTVYYAAVLPEYLPQVVDILADILRPSLRQDDFDTEKGVIIGEIARYDDNPFWSAYDRSKRVYFADHQLGNSILGTPESITALTREQMLAYFERRYAASNIVVAAAGQFDFNHLVGLVTERCQHWQSAPVGREGVRPTSGSGAVEVVVRPKLQQETVFLLSPGPAVDSPLREAAATLAVILGDDSGSRLYWELVDPGLAETAGISFQDYQGTGVFFTYFGCEPEQTRENLEVVHRLLEQARRDGITAEELQQAKSKILSQLVRGGERPMGRMNAVGSSWADLKRYRTVDEEVAAYDAVTLSQLHEVLEQFPATNPTTVALGPLETLDA